MAELEYTIEVVGPLGVSLPSGDEMADIVKDALARWYGDEEGALIDVEVTNVSDDL